MMQQCIIPAKSGLEFSQSSDKQNHRMHRLSAATPLIAFQTVTPFTRTSLSFSSSVSRPLISSAITSSKRLRHTPNSHSPHRHHQYQQASPLATAAAKASTEREEFTVTPRAEDYSAWYQSVITSADLCSPSPVRGCPIIKPHGYAIWELLRDTMDARIKKTGVSNAYFPLLIPQSFLSKEAEHVDGFAKECAVVTHHRLRASDDGSGTLEPDPDAEFEDPLIIRPTSETIIWHSFSKWISSYRDLPLQINQWANVLRWEMRPRTFLRTAEFLWQEGHTAHVTADEANTKAIQMIDLYASVVKDMLAMPVIIGVKSPSERFAGAVETYTIEAQMQNGWALQAGTSHYLGDGFSKAFDVTYTDADGTLKYPYGTSWGSTTRLIGALVMTHSDDTGLILPPAVAPVQIAIVLIFKNEQQREAVCALAEDVRERLEGHCGLRVKIDDREGMRPGAKYYEWERKGVPLRLEIGPKDAAKKAVFAARRIGGKKSIAVDDDFETNIKSQLDGIHTELYKTAEKRMLERMYRVPTYDAMKDMIASGGEDSDDNPSATGSTDVGFFLVPWKCDADNERKVKEETKATLRCYPKDLQDECVGKSCFFSGEAATHMAIFARAF